MKRTFSQPPSDKRKSAFTLVELLIAMSITLVILLVMLTLTATVADAWKRSRGAVFSNASARVAFDRIVTDFESAYYVQSLGGAEWFRFYPDADSGLENSENDGSFAPTWAMFYTSPTDRDVAQAGDVIGLSYRLAKQPVVGNNADYDLWALYRAFPVGYEQTDGSGGNVNPAKVTFDELLGKSDIHADFWAGKDAITRSPDYLLAANVLDFQIVSWIRLTDGNLQKVPSESEVSVTSEGVTIDGSPLTGARLYAVEISLTILSDSAIDHMREGTYRGLTVEKFLQQNSWSFTRLIRLYPESELTIQP